MEASDKQQHHSDAREISPLSLGGGMDPYGIREIVVEFDNGDSDIFRAVNRSELHSYELHQLATYLQVVAHSIRTG